MTRRSDVLERRTRIIEAHFTFRMPLRFGKLVYPNMVLAHDSIRLLDLRFGLSILSFDRNRFTPAVPASTGQTFSHLPLCVAESMGLKSGIPEWRSPRMERLRLSPF